MTAQPEPTPDVQCTDDACVIAMPILRSPQRFRPVRLIGRYVLLGAVIIAWVAALQYSATISAAAPIVLVSLTAALLIGSKLRTSRRLARNGGLEGVLVNGKPTVVEVYSDFCLPCIAVKPLVSQLRHDVGSAADVVQLSIVTPAGIRAAKQFAAVATPTFMLFDTNGHEIWRGNAPPASNAVLNAG